MPGHLNLSISYFHKCQSSWVRLVMWPPSPIINPWVKSKMFELFILQHKWYSPNFQWNFERELRKAPLRWQLLTLKSTDMQLDLPSSSHDLMWVSPWPQGQPWFWSLLNKRYNIQCCLISTLFWCLNFGSVATFNGILSQKTKQLLGHWPDLCGHHLMWDLYNVHLFSL